MNEVNQNGVRVTQTEKSIIYNGVEHQIPKNVKKKGSNQMEMVNGKVKINGFIFNPKTGEFKKDSTFIWIIIVILACILYYCFLM